jgi:hypothetical protein
MPRVSLSVPAASGPLPMTQGIAEQVFLSHDDTVFERHPTDPDAAAVGKWELNAANNPIRRQFEGNYSWMVTLTPAHLDAVFPAPVTRYNVSIALFYKRNLNARVNDQGVEVERLVDIKQRQLADLAGFGLGGGELLLEGAQNASLSVNQANTLVRPGQWIMVSGRYGNSSTSPAVFRWYRVVTVGEYDPNRNERPITVAGPDWIGVTDQNPNNWKCKPTHVAVFEGCIGVFEKTVHLEGPSMWGY